METENAHVVVVSQHYPPDKSGNASRISDTCTHLSDKGWDVTVLAPPPAFPHGEFNRSWKRKSVSEDGGVVVQRLWAWQPTDEDPGFLSRMAYYLLFPIHALLWLLFNHDEYDAIITSAPPIFTGLAGLPFGVLGWKPWIVDVRDLWIDASIGLGFISEGGLLERVSRVYERFVLQTADRVSVTTNVLGDRLTDLYAVDSEKVVHLPNGVNTDEFQPSDEPKEPVIVYTGNVGHAQDLEACVKAMAKVDHPDAVLQIVGDGDLRGSLEELAVEIDVEDKVEFTGLVSREEIPEILSKSMIGVAPLKQDDTLEYAIPTKAYEYMSCELPVIATGVGEIEELMAESSGGLYVGNDASEIADTIEMLLTDTSQREILGQQGREHMIDHYDREVVAGRLSNTLREITLNE
ncbi:glycosyltransferase family 4 protein [Halorubrum miltondacostae]|uniref:Glycosyltransferase family 4 protein n=1 Tax=Halorubrum miltondacostae TaxID=3076378 RepID=A0ABD5M5X7_9EURY